MDFDQQPGSSTLHNIPNGSAESNRDNGLLDLVGGPFAVIESDPGVFTSLARKLGIKSIEVVELYDIEPWAVEHLSPRGLIFCFLWHKDSHRPADFDDAAAERVWFANQLSDDACASHAILNVVLNCPDIEIGDNLRAFKQETEKMSPVMRGLAVTNSQWLRGAHNSFARPADLRGALNTLAITTLREAKLKARIKDSSKTTPKRGAKIPPAKRTKLSSAASPKKEKEEDEQEEAYHFVGYVPAYGKVWELDGLKSGPLEVGELSPENTSNSGSDWMNVVRPALRMKMEKYGGAAEGGSNIRFSLLAIVDGLYEKASDELELLKRERTALENRLDAGWEEKVDADLLESARHLGSLGTGTTYARDFGSRKMNMNIEVMEMPERNLIFAWEKCIRNTLRAQVAVEDEVAKAVRANTDHVKRTFDYEPFFVALVERLHAEDLLTSLLDLNEDGRKIKRKGDTAKVTPAASKGRR